MSIIKKGPNFVFGVCEPMRPHGFPAGRIRFRLRAGKFGRAFVRSADAFFAFYIKEVGGSWEPGPVIGHNSRETIHG